MNISKGVICKVVPDEEMPVDQYGVHADVVFCNIATVNRMNLGRRYEPRILSAGFQVANKIRRSLGVNENMISGKDLTNRPNNMIEDAWQYLLGFYKIVSPVQFHKYSTLDHGRKLEHLALTCNRAIHTKYGVRLHMPIRKGRKADRILSDLRKSVYNNPAGPVRYRGDSGKWITTKTNVRIGPQYIFALDKISDDNNSVAAAATQMFGVPALTNKANRYVIPTRANPTRVTGETEGRIEATAVGAVSTAERIDRNNTPEVLAEMYRRILTDEKPTKIKQLIDRNVYKYGGSRPLQNGKHILFCAGIKLKYVPYQRKV